MNAEALAVDLDDAENHGTGDKAKTDIYNTISDAVLSSPPYQNLCYILWQH